MLPQSEHFVTLLDLTAVDNIVLNLYSFNIVLFDLVFFFFTAQSSVMYYLCSTFLPVSCFSLILFCRIF